MSEYQTKAKKQRDRAFIARITIKYMAAKLGYSRVYLTQVLNGKIESEIALDAVRKFLDKAEDEHEYAAMAA